MTPLEALQTRLADEHLAVHLYGVLGARTSASAAPELHAALVRGYQRHRARRDALRTLVIDAGGTPVPAEPAYAIPPGWVGAGRITRAAADVEERSTEGLAALVASTAGAPREWAIAELVWSAVQGITLGAAATPWPGAPELA